MSSQRSRSLFDAGPSVPRPDPDTPGQELRQRGHSRGQLGVALGAVGHGHVVVASRGSCPRGTARCCGRPGPDRRRRPRRPGPRGPIFRARRETVPSCSVSARWMWKRASSSRADGGDVGEHGKGDREAAWGAKPTSIRSWSPWRRAWKSTISAILLSHHRPSGAGELQDPGGDQGPRSRGHDGVGQCVLEEVGLTGGGHPEAQELGGGQGHAPEHIVLGEMGLLRPQHLVEPLVEGQTLPRTPEQGHRRVAVHVDQSGEEGALDPDLPGAGPAWSGDPACPRG